MIVTRRSKHLVTSALMALIVSGCAAGPGGSVPYSPVGFGAPDEVLVQRSDEIATIVPMDKLRVTVFQEENVSGDFAVDAAGRIDYPLLGLLEVQGLTAPQLSEMIRTRLASSYFRDPKVQVTLTEAAARTVTVEGAVGRSGIFPIEGQTTLIRAVALANGTTQDANDSRVIVFRQIGGQRMAAAFDLKAIRRAEAEDPRIYGNDVIVVPGSGNRQIWQGVLGALPVIGIFSQVF